jgi:hypothetical protein
MKRALPLLLLVLLSGCTTRQTVLTSSEMQGATLNNGLWTREELFFGLGKPNGDSVTAAQFDAFAAREIASRLDGYTILQADGYYTYTAPSSRLRGTTVHEPSRILIVMYSDAERDVAAKLSAIALLYIRAFSQESVLRTTVRVRGSFIK